MSMDTVVKVVGVPCYPKLLTSTRTVGRVDIDLTAQQDEDAGRDGEDCQNHAEATECRDKCRQARDNEPDSEQQHT